MGRTGGFRMYATYYTKAYPCERKRHERAFYLDMCKHKGTKDNATFDTSFTYSIS